MGANGALIDAQNLITPANGGVLPEATVTGQGQASNVPQIQVSQLPIAEVKVPEIKPIH